MRQQTDPQPGTTRRTLPALERLGIFLTFDYDDLPLSDVLDAAQTIENLGYGAIWVPEQNGRESVSMAALLLSATQDVIVATGIARASARDARTMAAAQRTLAEAFPGRFLLGIGGQTRLDVGDPVANFRRYLTDFDESVYRPPEPPPQPRVLAAINPRMLRLAAESAAGAMTYLCPPEHTRAARSILGEEPILIASQTVVLEADRERALSISRAHLSFYLQLPAYRRMLKQLGFTDEDFTAGGSERAVDAIVASGEVANIQERVQRHLDAGANHVCLQVLSKKPGRLPTEDWEVLAETFVTDAGCDGA